MRTQVRWLLVLIAMVMEGAAGAQSSENENAARARAHFETGLGLYHLGHFGDAAREFAAGYHLVPKAEFLINLGQAYRKLKDLGKARDMFARFLDEASPDHPERESVERLLREIDHALQAEPPSVASQLSAPKLQSSGDERAPREASPPHRVTRAPAWRQPLFWIGVLGGFAVVTGAAVAIGVIMTPSYPTPTSGAFTF